MRNTLSMHTTMKTADDSVSREWLCSREDLRDIQNLKLKALLAQIVPANRFWTSRFQQAGIDPAQVRSINDLASLPLITKQEIVGDFNAHPPYGSNLTYPTTSYARFHQTSGTTGRPLVWMDTHASWSWFMDCWKLIYHAVEITCDDRFCFPFSFGPFIGFWAAFEGATQNGNLTIPAGGLSTTARIRLILDQQCTVICCTPTYALRMVEVAAQEGIDIRSSHVRAIIVAGEPGGNIPATREKIESAWGARVYDHWGMTEIGSLGIEPHGDPGNLYILETQAIPEVIDPATGQFVEPGQVGELVITNLGRWGNPLIRYRTGDLVRPSTSPSPCGCSFLRLEGGVLGRVDDMVTIRGNNVYPSSIEAVLREFPEIVEYRMTVSTQRSMKQMLIEVELQPTFENLGEVNFMKRLHATIKDRLNFQPDLKRVAAGELPRFELKGRRLVRLD
ncbi:phenylacetate--CoA ligase family protein [Lacunimicrobium album]